MERTVELIEGGRSLPRELPSHNTLRNKTRSWIKLHSEVVLHNARLVFDKFESPAAATVATRLLNSS